MTSREEMLLKMYDQMFNDINRHILVVWQCIGVLVSAFAVFVLVEKKVVTLDIAASIALLLSAWLVAHLFDAAYWYNRNLVIIANIERQFLHRYDLKEIQYYFGSHRNNEMIDHLRIQMALAIGLGGIIAIYHFVERVLPNIPASINNSDLILLILPYILIIFVFCLLYFLKKHFREKYEEFLEKSPGIGINTDDIKCSVGHANDES